MDNLNIGVQKAQEAVLNNGLEGFIAPNIINDNKTDFNDVMKEKGINEVKKQIEKNVIELKPLKISKDISVKLKEFNADLLLPESIRDFVINESKNKPVAMEMVVIPLIAGLSSLLAGKVYMKPKENDDFLITPNLWGFTIAEPSSKKSSAMKSALCFFNPLEDKAQEEYQEKITDYNKKINEYKIAKKVYDEELGKAFKSGKTDKIEIAKQNLAKLIEPEKVCLERFRVQDATTQKITEILRDNKNPSILLERDEISGFLSNLERKEYESDRAYFLELWEGSVSKASDTIGRGSIFVKNASLAIMGTTQPDKITNYLLKTQNGNNDGLLQRFQLMVYPESILRQYIDEKPNLEARKKVAKIAKFFNETDFINISPNFLTKDEQRKAFYNFDAEAQETYIKWCNSLFKKIERYGQEGKNLLAQHLGKYEKLLPSIALIFHLMQEDERLKPISNKTLTTAILFCHHLENHAQKIYGILESDNKSKENALSLINHIKRSIKNNDKSPYLQEFTIRDLTRNYSKLKDKELEDALSQLVDHQYLFENHISSGFQQKATTRYILNSHFINEIK